MSISVKPSIKKVKKEGVKEINAGLVANTENLHLRVKILKGGKEIYNERANSLLANFVGLLGYWMGPMETRDTGLDYMDTTVAHVPKTETYMHPTGHAHGHQNMPQHPQQATIVSWPQSDTVRINHITTAAINRTWRSGHYLSINANPDNSGIYKILDVTVHSTSETSLQLEGLNADPSDSTDGYCIGFPMWNMRRYSKPQGSTQTSGHLNRIYIGKSSTPVSLYDVWLHDGHLISDFSGYDVTINPPVIAVNQSRIAISAQFTNISGETRSVAEIGLTTSLRGHSNIASDSDILQSLGWLDRDLEPTLGMDTNILMIARDVVTAFPVEPAESFTVIYEIVSSVNSEETSGVVAAFNEILYRQFAQANRVVRTYFNIDHNLNQRAFPYLVTDDFVHYRVDLTIFGPILGSEETDVDIDDYFLRNVTNGHSRIGHGAEDGRLYYYKPKFEDMVRDANECYFVVERFVENRGSVNVTAKQVGFVVASGEDRFRPALITHDVLPVSDQITFEPGDVYRIRYKIGVAQN